MAKILVIDDDRGIRHLLGTFLRHKGYEVLLAGNGQDGLELLRQEHLDVIVLDLQMPDMDGLTVLRHIRSLNAHQPVIIFSGAYTEKMDRQIRILGITELVTKDGSLDDLGEALKRALASPDSGEGDGE
ncbi:MAG: response regulator [Nitrospirota bacterium]